MLKINLEVDKCMYVGGGPNTEIEVRFLRYVHWASLVPIPIPTFQCYTQKRWE